MLLFTKKIHADKLRSGEKTIELRSGARYRHVKSGDSLSINGQFRLTVVEIQSIDSETLDLFADCYHRECGFSNVQEMREALADCYSAIDTLFAFHVTSPNQLTFAPA